MANEVTITTTLSYTKNKAHASLGGSFSATQSGDKYLQNVQIVGTVEEAIVKGDIGTIGFCSFRNMDTTNFVQIGASAGNYTIKLLAGESTGAIRWSSSAAYAKADTGSCEVEYLLIEA